MTRRNKLRHTILIYCEGQRDCDFVKHLKSIFCKNKTIKVQPGQGGGPSIIIQNAVKYNHAVEYKEKYIFLDSDGLSEDDKKQKEKEAKKQDIILIWSPICLENLWLQILNGHPKMNNSQECKKYFNEHYKGRKLQFMRLFSKEKLSKKKDTLPTLKKLIEMIS